MATATAEPPVFGKPAWAAEYQMEETPAAPAATGAAAPVEPELKIPDRAPIKGPAKGADPKANPATADKELEEADEDGTKWPRNGGDWKQFKASRKTERENAKKERDELAAKVKDYEEKLKTAPAAPAVDYDPEWKPKLTAAEKRAQELNEALQLSAVQNHPDFIRYFKDKTDKQLDLAGNIVPVEKADRVKKVLSAPPGEWRDQQLEELIGDMTPIQQARFGAVVNSLDQIQQERSGEIANASTRYQQLKDSEKAKATKTDADRNAKIKSVIDATKARLADNPAFQKRDGDDAWNKSVEDRMNNAQALLDGKVSVETGVEAAFHATAYKPLLESYKALHASTKAEIDALKKQVSDLSSASPRTEGARPTNKEANGNLKRPEFKPGMRPTEAGAEYMRGLWATANPA